MFNITFPSFTYIFHWNIIFVCYIKKNYNWNNISNISFLIKNRLNINMILDTFILKPTKHLYKFKNKLQRIHSAYYNLAPQGPIYVFRINRMHGTVHLICNSELRLRVPLYVWDRVKRTKTFNKIGPTRRHYINRHAGLIMPTFCY